MQRLKALIFDSEAQKEMFWFGLYIAWVPVIFGQNLFPFLGGNEDTPLLLADQKWISHPALGVLTAIAVFMFIISIRLKSWEYLIPTAFCTYSCFIYLFNANADWSLADAGFYYLYVTLFLSTVWIFMRLGHVLSSSFAIFLVLLVADVIVFKTHESLVREISTPFSILSLGFHNYAPSLLATLIFVIAMVLLRVIYLAWRDNRDLYAQLREHGTKGAIRQTLRLWWPMPVIFAIFLVLYSLAFSAVEKEAAAALYTEAYQEQPVPEGLTLQEALKTFADVKISENARALNDGIESTKTQIQDKSATTPGSITSTVSSATDGRLAGTQTSRCGFLDVFCLVANGVKSMANSAYQNARRKAISSMKRDLQAANSRVQGDGDQFSAAAQEIVTGLETRISALSIFSINAIFFTYRTVSWLMFVYSLIILTKTFMMIYARIIFDPKRENPMSAQFKPGTNFRAKAEISRRKSTFTVRKDVPDDRYFCYHDIQLKGPPPARTFPLGFRFVFPRLLSRRMSFRYVEGRRSGNAHHSAKITIDPPKEVVEWKLRKKETVVFRWGDLIGFSRGVKFRRIASLSLSSLIFGRIIFYSAEGEGTIYLKTLSGPEISTEKARRLPFGPPALIAWQAPIRIYVDASLTTLNAFLSSYNITTEQGNDYVCDTSEVRERGVTGGILRFVKTFLLPI